MPSNIHRLIPETNEYTKELGMTILFLFWISFDDAGIIFLSLTIFVDSSVSNVEGSLVSPSFCLNIYQVITKYFCYANLLLI